MAELVFKLDEVQARLDHAKASKEHSKTFGMKEGKPGLLLVHDHGVYLMSTGIPRETRTDYPERSIVAHAEGCDPDINDDYYDTSKVLVGGDDFADYLSADDVQDAIDRARLHSDKLIIEITRTHIGYVDQALRGPKKD